MKIIHLTMPPSEAELLRNVIANWSAEYATTEEAEILSTMIKALDQGLGR